MRNSRTQASGLPPALLLRIFRQQNKKNPSDPNKAGSIEREFELFPSRAYICILSVCLILHFTMQSCTDKNPVLYCGAEAPQKLGLTSWLSHKQTALLCIDLCLSSLRSLFFPSFWCFPLATLAGATTMRSTMSLP